MNDVKVSVIIPVYNAETYLRQCLASVVSQTLKPVEIICIDDGSTDNSKNILNEFEKNYCNFKVLTQTNSGSGIARNKGLASAQGKYIAFMDADDYYPSDKCLELMYTAATIHCADICGGSLRTDLGNSVRSFDTQLPIYVFKKEQFISYDSVQFDYGYQRYIFRSKLLHDNNIAFPNYLRFQDPPFFVKAMICAGKFYAIQEETYCYRWGHQQINWNHRKICDLIRGLTDNLIISAQHQLKILHMQCIQRVNKEYSPMIASELKKGNIELFSLLIKFNNNISEDILSENGLYDTFYIINPLKDVIIGYSNGLNSATICDDYIKSTNAILNSYSYRVGRFITFIPRKIRGGIRCLRENGIRYTLRRINEKIFK